MKPISYVVITPVRNERQHIDGTIRSMTLQTVRPRRWVIVDDGSTDDTGQVAEQAAREHSWITVVHRPDRGFRKPGGGVIEAFYAGFEKLGEVPWDFGVKLDGDLSFAPEYFEKCFEHFDVEPSLGIGGGTICNLADGKLVPESPHDVRFHVRGATKIYRRACWDAIGGLIQAPGWDTLDEIKANMLGWVTCTFAELPLTHHKHAGEADGTWKNWFKNGRANYIVGYHPVFMLSKCAGRMARRPYAIEPWGLLAGFVSGYLRRVPQISDRELIRYLRRQQMNRLIRRKSLWDQ